jgi:DedD protein
MNKSMRNKILGAFVVVGLIIIALPFFQNSGEVPATAALVSAPTFPDQTLQVAAEQQQPTPSNDVPKQVNDSPVTPDKMSEATITTSDNTPSNTTGDIKQVPDDTVQDLHNTESNATVPAITAPAATEPTKDTTKKKPTTVKKVAQTKVKKAAPKQAAITENGLTALKNPAWVVQMGSFKNKANALRMVNQLRASGYRAFIQKTTTTFGENTRVFVGPENKPDSARTLASKLESDMHLHGIVISYKPLAL